MPKSFKLSHANKLFFLYLGYVLICQMTTLIYPGKEPMMFYFCVGKMSESLIGVKPKNNQSFNITILITMVTHLISFIHIKCKKNNALGAAAKTEHRSTKDHIFR